MASLTLVVKDREVRTFALGPTVTTIGRAQDNDIVVNNLSLSRRHAEVHRRGFGYELIDRGSQNGVYVNDQRLEGPRMLEDNDVVTLGTYTFVFGADPLPEVAAGRRSSAEPADEPTPPPARMEPATPIPALGPSSVPMVLLTFNELELQRFVLEEDECLIGRAKECDVQITERRLSRRHCLLFQDDAGNWLVKDLGSQNGTFVNRRRVRDSQLLRHGDVLNFAEYSVQFLSDGPAGKGADRMAAPTVRPSSGIEREQTELPEAYREEPPGLGPVPEPVVSEPPRTRRPRPGRQDRRDSPMGPDLRSPPEQRPPRSEPRRDPPPADPRAEPRRRPPSPIRVEPRYGPPVTSRVDSRRDPPSQGPEPRREPDRAGPKPDPRLEPVARSEPRREPVEPRIPRLASPKSRDVAPRGSNSPEPERRDERTPGRPPEPELAFEPVDVPDPRGDGPRPDPSLDQWYAARDVDAFGDEPSVLLERSKSSMSQLLSTMMVDKRELDRNLEVARRRRRFTVLAQWGEERLFEGLLEQDVTILGSDRESDIPLKGRYVAGRHSLLVRVRDSLLLVRLGSSSAARVNGLPRLQAFLKGGDVIQIDETTLYVTES